MNNSWIERKKTKPIFVGSVGIGGDHPISIQSMTNTNTADIKATVNQIEELEAAGADIVRVSVPDEDCAKAFKKIKNSVSVPLVADIHFDLHKIPLDDNKIDVLFCNHVLEHVEDAMQCMRELHRVMKPGGWGIMQVPQDFSRSETYEDPSITSPEEREKHFWQKDHVRLFGMDYQDWLETAGFEVERFEVNAHMSPEQVNRFRINPKEILYIARKV